MEQDIERIKIIIEEMSRRYQAREGAITFAGIGDNGTVRIAPSGFCWR